MSSLLWKARRGAKTKNNQKQTEPRFLLAGGLTPDNVAAAIAQAHPWGVDISTGVATNSAKDPIKIRQFIHQARAASLSQNIEN